MNIKPIRSDTDYRAMLADIEGLMAAAPESAAWRNWGGMAAARITQRNVFNRLIEILANLDAAQAATNQIRDSCISPEAR